MKIKFPNETKNYHSINFIGPGGTVVRLQIGAFQILWGWVCRSEAA
tara:strand:- start:31 stop:168 length:138 start_codon:yes stop_codon:yes gene_type:complete